MTVARASALALLAATLAPCIALAQGSGAAPPPPGAAAPGHDHRDPGAVRERMQAHRAERLQALRTVLRIRPDQEPAFQAYAAAVGPQPRTGGPDHQGAEGGAPTGQLTTPQRLDRIAQRMEEGEARRHAAFQRRADATKALYAALDPQQRQALDALPELMGFGGHGWGKGGQGGHRGGGHDDGRPMGPSSAQGE